MFRNILVVCKYKDVNLHLIVYYYMVKYRFVC